MVNALPSDELAISPRAVANLKRSVVVSVPLGLLALVALVLLGHPLAGLFLLLGLGLGMLNTRLMHMSLVVYGSRRSKGGFVVGMASRLFALTGLAIGAVVLVRPDGVGLLIGLAVFQVIALLIAAVPVLRGLRG